LDIGVGPVAVCENDLIRILYGCMVPIVLRPKGSLHEVIGDSHINGFMKGEAIEKPGRHTQNSHEFVIE
jgi:hypothetical protein